MRKVQDNVTYLAKNNNPENIIADNRHLATNAPTNIQTSGQVHTYFTTNRGNPGKQALAKDF